MKFTKLSIASAFALAMIPCFAANFAADIKTVLEETRAMELDNGGNGKKFASRNRLFEMGSQTMVSKNLKERSDFSKALSDAVKLSKDKEEQIYMFYVLQFTGGEESLKTIESFLSDKDNDIADAARMALERNSSPRANDVLNTAVNSTKDPLRQAALVNAIAVRKSNLAMLANAQKNAKDKAVVAATYIAKRDWPEIDYAVFQQEFLAAPGMDGVKKGISAGACDRSFVLVAPYVFTKAGQAQFLPFKNRFANSDAVTQAWVISRLAGIPEAKKFILESVQASEDPNIKMAGAWALSEYPAADSVKAILEIQQKFDGSVRFQAEYALAAMAPSKDVDKALTDVAKSGQQKHEAIRSMRVRGMTDAIPFLLKNVKDNNDRAVSAEALVQLADDKAFLEFAKIVADTKDDDLGRRLVGMAAQMAKRAGDHAKIVNELAKLEARTDDKTKRALARARDVILVEVARIATESRQKGEIDMFVKLAESAAKVFSGNVEADLEKLKEKTSNEGRQAIDKVKEIIAK